MELSASILQKSTEFPPLEIYRAQICKRLRSPGIDSTSPCSLARGGPVRQIWLLYRPARLGIDSWAP
jgi:hypothetical protein